ncbi:hypothetical protein K438DRAFT_1979024 [Mycena galopus ATCC 62051]|nr:hypothetical protein K438DRAFT_1979024 [Mycena galopus ATCC 62051]
MSVFADPCLVSPLYSSLGLWWTLYIHAVLFGSFPPLIPPECLVTVFRWLMIAVYYRRPEDWWTARRVLLHVCSYWRDLVLTSAVLWSHVYLGPNAPLIRLESAILLSSSLDLSVHIRVIAPCYVPLDGAAAYFDVLAPHMHRCVYLVVECDDYDYSRAILQRLASFSAPALRFLAFNVSYPFTELPLFGGSAPSLTESTLAECTVPSLPLLLPYSALRHLCIVGSDYVRHTDMSHWSSLFDALPALISLGLCNVHCEHGPYMRTGGRIGLPGLTHLSLSGQSGAAFYAFLGDVYMPALHTLLYATTDEYDVDAFCTQCPGILRRVASCALHLDGIPDYCAVALYALLNTVQRLDIRLCSFTAFANYWEHVAGYHTWPALRWVLVSPVSSTLTFTFASRPSHITRLVAFGHAVASHWSSSRFLVVDNRNAFDLPLYAEDVNFWQDRLGSVG